LGGSADAGSTVTILDGATQLGTVIATAGGTWNLLFGLASSTRNLSIQATDTAGNIASPPAPTPFHFGSAGDDVLLGAAGANVFVGGPGDDTFEVDDPGDIVFEALGEGNDTVLASVGYTLGANARVEFLKAAATVTSGLTLTGNGFANTIVGSAFADTLIGAGGADTLTGGGGPDRFTFLGLTDSTLGAAGRDQVTDYSVADGDLLDFSALDANSALAGDQAFIFIGLAAFSGVAGQLRVAAGAGLTVVSGDVNGDSTADFAVTLLGSPVLGPGNFVL
jgi:Ca2+-binding RTX toxin-like protein